MNSSDNQKGNNSYFKGLNGLRALAALIVFLSHAVGFVSIGLYNQFLLFDGSAAVILFIILSGFFLSVKYVGETTVHFNTLAFLIKRFFRLYPPYIAGLAVTLFLRYFIFQPGMFDGLSDWINSKWLYLPTLKDIILYCLLIGTSSSFINLTMWVMFYFIFLSILFPIVLIPLRNVNSIFGQIIFLAVTYLLAARSSYFTYLPYFVLGGIFAKYYKKMHLLMSQTRINKVVSIPILIVSLLLFNIRFTAPIFGLGYVPDHGIIVDSITSIGCLALMYYAITSKSLNLLLVNRPMNFIGKISYFIYILHFPILLTTTSIIYPLIPNILVSIILSFAFTVIFSFLLHKFVEKPFQRLGDFVVHLFNTVVLKSVKQ